MFNNDKDGGPVYPQGQSHLGGLSLRERFAETAMREMVPLYSVATLPVGMVAARAVQMADALLARLQETATK